MFEIIVGTSIYSFYITLYSYIIVMFSLRLLTVILEKTPLKPALIALFVPFSVGYFYIFSPQTQLRKTYRIINSIYFTLSILAAFFIFYMQK